LFIYVDKNNDTIVTVLFWVGASGFLTNLKALFHVIHPLLWDTMGWYGNQWDFMESILILMEFKKGFFWILSRGGFF